MLLLLNTSSGMVLLTSWTYYPIMTSLLRTEGNVARTCGRDTKSGVSNNYYPVWYHLKSTEKVVNWEINNVAIFPNTFDLICTFYDNLLLQVLKYVIVSYFVTLSPSNVRCISSLICCVIIFIRFTFPRWEHKFPSLITSYALRVDVNR